MSTLITGTQGQLGHWLLNTAPAGSDVVPVDRSVCDLQDSDALAALLNAHQPELIINAAAYTAVDKAEQDIASAMSVNGDAVAVMATYCRDVGARLIQVSTDFVFDGAASAPYTPDSPTAPLGVYGRTKLAGEQAALEGCETSCVVRTSWVYSEYGNNFVKTMLRLGAERDVLTVVNDQTGCPTDARNLATMLWTLGTRWPSGGQRIWHWSDAGAITWFDFAAAIFAEAVDTGLLEKVPEVRPISSAEFGAPAPRPAYSVLDGSGTTQQLGLTAEPWREALRDVLARIAASQ